MATEESPVASKHPSDGIRRTSGHADCNQTEAIFIVSRFFSCGFLTASQEMWENVMGSRIRKARRFGRFILRGIQHGRFHSLLPVLLRSAAFESNPVGKQEGSLPTVWYPVQNTERRRSHCAESDAAD